LMMNAIEQARLNYEESRSNDLGPITPPQPTTPPEEGPLTALWGDTLIDIESRQLAVLERIEANRIG